MSIEEIIEKLEKLKVETGSLACFGCGSEHHCSTQGCRIIREAVALLKTHPDAQPNNPLTLEELREMDGQPVWVQSPGIPEYGSWRIVAGVDTEDGERTLYCSGDYTCRDYGKVWLAYRRPPKEEKR